MTLSHPCPWCGVWHTDATQLCAAHEALAQHFRTEAGRPLAGVPVQPVAEEPDD